MNGNEIKELRKERGMSQQVLAEAAGVSQSAVSIIEAFNLVPSGELKDAIEKAFNIGREPKRTEKSEQITQTKRVLDYMIEHGSISQQEAIREFNCYRLAAKIFDLRKEGYVIITEKKPFRNEYCNGYYAEYKLAGGRP